MTALPLLCLVAVASYLVGAIPFGYLLARWRGHDILHEGSGNIGATNVGRVVGMQLGFLVFAARTSPRGALPVWLAGLLPPPGEVDLPPNTLPVVAGVAAFLGHLLPVYLRFRGGKGVATGLGVTAVLLPPVVTLAVLAVWGLVLAVTRYVSLASITAAALLFALQLWWTWPFSWDRAHVVVTLFCALAAALVCLRHHSNIRRLLQGRRASPLRVHHALPVQDPARAGRRPVVRRRRFLHPFRGAHVPGVRGGCPQARSRPPERGRRKHPVGRTSAAVAAGPRGPSSANLWEKASPIRRGKSKGRAPFGVAVGNLFPVYYGLQLACGVVARAAALAMARSGEGRGHGWRIGLCALALATVGLGWWLETVVADLRGPAPKRSPTTSSSLPTRRRNCSTGPAPPRRLRAVARLQLDAELHHAGDGSGPHRDGRPLACITAAPNRIAATR